MIEELKNYITKNNTNIINELINILKENNINTPKELSNYESDMLDTTNLEDKINHTISYYKSNINILYDLDYEKSIELKEYTTKVKETNDNIEKIISIIKVLEIMNMDNILPYQTYLLIVNKKII